MALFLDRLRDNAYKNLDVDDHVVDIDGWMQEDFISIFKNAIRNRNPLDNLTIIEVGTWKGLSASSMATILKDSNFTNFKIICVDTWLGAPEFWTWGLDDPTRGLSLKLVNGWPNAFTTFTKNMKKLGHDNVIIPLPLSSVQAADVLTYYKITADIIYIDAAHEYMAVKKDIDSYVPLLKNDGILIGDDYCDYWAGVKRAVNESFKTPIIEGSIWYNYK